MSANWPYVHEDTKPHPTHAMGEPRTEIRCPGSTPRFYTVRACAVCQAEMMGHAAGFFMHPALTAPCAQEVLDDYL